MPPPSREHPEHPEAPPARPWAAAWQDALYGTDGTDGTDGFYRSPAGPAGHFSTATHGTPGRVLARALLAYAAQLGCTAVVDLGAGRGELLAHLRALDADVSLLGVDVVDRPADLPADVGWVVSPGGADLPESLRPRDALVVAHEWLDVVPLTVGEVDAEGVARLVLVDSVTGKEYLGKALSTTDLEWCQRFWPLAGLDPGDRVEVGVTRDAAWSALLDRMEGGVALAVDYGHRLGERPREGTLTAYRQGVLVTPVPDGSCDLTAHVAVDSLRHDEMLTQREALRRLGVRAGTPDHALARTDPPRYLAGLAESGAAGALLDRSGYGGFWWVVARP
ncbi:SAM-dependent methyltransferase [Dermatophilaceae bacterium Soc4.6]